MDLSHAMPGWQSCASQVSSQDGRKGASSHVGSNTQFTRNVLQLWQVKSSTWHKGLHHAVCSPACVQYMCYIQLYLLDDETRTHHSQGSKGAGKMNGEWIPILLMCTMFVNCVYLRCDLSICLECIWLYSTN